MNRGKTDEEKVAIKITNLLSDLRLNLDRVGIYLARTEPSTNYKRLLVVAESADEEWNNRNGKHNRIWNEGTDSSRPVD